MRIGKKLLAALLSLLLLVEMMPLQVFAAGASGEVDDESAIVVEEPDEAGTKFREIIGEAEEYREEDAKHFLNADGSYTAVKYAQPVHYRTEPDGNWLNIDNSPILIDADKAPGVSRARQAGSSAFEQNTTQVYVPQSSPLDVILATSTDAPYLATLNSGTHTVSWRIAVDRSDVQPEALAYSEAKPMTFESDGAEESAQIQAVRNVIRGLVYPDVSEDVDLEYIMDSLQLKENIVLKSSGAANRFHLTYAVGDLTAQQKSEQEIALLDAAGETVYTIYAPYMTDAANVSSGSVTLELLSAQNGEVTVLLSADSEWLEDPARSYPVRIDPYVFQGIVSFDQDATAIYKPHTIGASAGTLLVGNDNNYNYGKMRTYVKFTLPTLAAGDVVIGSKLNIREYTVAQGGYSAVGHDSLQINAYQVTSTWTESGIWNSTYYNNLPSMNSTVVDYRAVSNATCGTWVTFDVTRMAKEWYENLSTNYGICLEAADTSAWAVAEFIASNNTPHSAYRPTLEVDYLNSRGLEGRWTNHIQSLGRSGSSYTNDYTGNLVFAAPLLSTTGNRMPVALTLYYNSCQRSEVNLPNKLGEGWRLNMQEKLTAITSTGSDLWAKLYALNYRYIYEDADGTQHYFRLKDGSTSVCEDEEGMGLTLTVNSTVTDLEKYVIEADTGGKMTFTAGGYLRKIYDTDGNFCKVLFDSSARITQIIDGANRTIQVTSDSNGRITQLTDPAGRVTSITYTTQSGKTYVNKITYPDGKYTQFTYSTGGLSQAVGADGCKLTYGYGSTPARGRVETVTEYGVGGVEGASLTMDYSALNRTVFTDNKGRAETYQFDNSGRTVGILDAAGNLGVYKYVSGSEENNKTTNALKSASVGKKHVTNLLRNHSFERSGSWTLSAGSAQIATDAHYLGTSSVKLTGSGADATQTVDILSGCSEYTFSAYVKTSASTTAAAVCMRFLNAGGSVLSTVTSNSINFTSDWQRICINGTAPSGTARITVRCLTGGDGDAWFDCTQLELGLCLNAYNMVENGNFDDTGVSVWTMYNNSSADGILWSGSDGYYRLYGSAGVEKMVYQSIPVNRVGNKTFLTIRGHGRALSVPLDDDRTFGLGVEPHYTDGTIGGVQRVSFNPDYTAGWQYTAGTVGFNTSKKISYIVIFCSFGKNANWALFDCIQVNLDESGVTYTYDTDGNLISATDNAKRNETYTYNNASEITNVTTADNKNYTYTYAANNQHRLMSATSVSSDVKFSFTYDSYGNVTSTQVRKSDGTGKYIKQETAYTSNGSYVAAANTGRPFDTLYDYNTTKGTLNSVTNPLGNSTYYTYNADNDRLLTVSDNSNANASSASTVSYGYNTYGYLASLTTPSTAYAFTYDSFGNPKKTQAGDNTLVENTYAANNGNLTSTEYGNGFTVGFVYDSLDRVTSRKYNGTAKYTWAYNADGQVGRHQDNENGKTYTYTYDNLGRPRRMDVSDGSWLRYGYNTVDQATKLRYRYSGTTRAITYAYSEADNLPASVTFSSGKVTNGYDDLTRLTQRAYKTNAGDDGVTVDYSYLDYSDQTRTTGVVRVVDYTYAAGKLDLPDLFYSYDCADKITAEREWLGNDNSTLRERYEYDGKDQLIRHDSATQNASFTYSYDKAGNITSKNQYAYTTGTLGAVQSTKTYTYSTGSWGDLLTSYDGNAITYDGMGNMTSYNGRTYTWNGRELAQIQGGGNTHSYKYNADGIRTSKTVNGTTTEYFLNGSQILAQKTGDSVMWYYYDSTGLRVGVTCNGYLFYYLYNLQGDVIGLARATTGQVVARYSYDAWGNCTVTNASGYTIGTRNPFRYRGYYYDDETGLYYLNSRYYNPEWGRFISADDPGYLGVEGKLLNYNLYAYCLNDPVNRIDEDGNLSIWAKFAIGVAVIAVAAVVTVATAGAGAVGAAAAIHCAAAGALEGAITGAVTGAAMGAATSAVSHRIQTGSWKGAGQAALEGAATGFMTGAITGAVMGGATSKYCFVAGTLVQTEDGPKSIEEVQPGDRVWAWNEETGEIALKPVVETYVNETDELMHVHVSGEEIVTTPGHPFYSPVKGWTSAVNLRAGDILVLVNGEYVIVEQVQHELLEAPVKVYNFNVEEYHTYYVTDSGVLVHNACQNPGRAGKQARLRELANDDKLSSALRGEIKRDLNMIARGQRTTIRVPSGYNLAHRIGYSAKDGFSYAYSDLQTIAGHKLHHLVFGR